MPAYYGIATDTGKAAIAAFAAGGEKVNIIALAVGDGGGAYYRPTADMTWLKNEIDVYGNGMRLPVAVSISDVSPNVISVEATLPPEVGGFTVRELGAYDDRGRLIGICNTPASPKVVLEDGASVDMVLILEFAVADAAAVHLHANPAVLATKRELAAITPSTFLTAFSIPSADFYVGWALYDFTGGVNAPLETWGFTNATLTEIPGKVVCDINNSQLRIYTIPEYAGRSWTVTRYQDGIYILSAADRSLLLTRR